MYHYYNYLFIEQNKDKFSNSKNRSFHNTTNNDFILNDSIHSNGKIEEEDFLLKLDSLDEKASTALGYNRKSFSKNNKNDKHQEKHPEIFYRYSNDDLLRIFKNLGRFEHPLNCKDSFKIDSGSDEITSILQEITNPKANVVIELLKDEMHEKGKSKAKKNHVLVDLDHEIQKQNIIKN